MFFWVHIFANSGGGRWFTAKYMNYTILGSKYHGLSINRYFCFENKIRCLHFSLPVVLLQPPLLQHFFYIYFPNNNLSYSIKSTLFLKHNFKLWWRKKWIVWNILRNIIIIQKFLVRTSVQKIIIILVT